MREKWSREQRRKKERETIEKEKEGNFERVDKKESVIVLEGYLVIPLLFIQGFEHMPLSYLEC